jgi:hypothetical protein
MYASAWSLAADGSLLKPLHWVDQAPRGMRLLRAGTRARLSVPPSASPVALFSSPIPIIPRQQGDLLEAARAAPARPVGSGGYARQTANGGGVTVTLVKPVAPTGPVPRAPTVPVPPASGNAGAVTGDTR